MLRFKPTEEWKSGIGAHTTRIVCAGGVVLRRVTESYPAPWNPDTWEYHSRISLSDPVGNATSLRGSLEQFVADHQLRPIAAQAVHGAGNGDGPTLWFTLARRGPALEMQVQRLTDQAYEQARSLRTSATLLFATAEVVYHCRQLATSYAELREFRRDPWGRTGTRPYNLGLAPAFEFEAILSAAIRAFEVTRFMLWPSLGLQNAPRSFARMVQQVQHNDSALGNRVLEIAQWHERAKEYRDYIQHYGTLTPNGAYLSEQPSGLSVVRMLLPDNPGAVA